MAWGAFLPAGDYDPELIDDAENEKAKQADIEDQFWRLLYLIPVIINVIMLLNFVLFINEDSIMFNLSEENEEQALILIDKVYHAQEDRQEILAALKNQVKKKSKSELSYWESLFGEKYLRGTLVAMTISALL